MAQGLHQCSVSKLIANLFCFCATARAGTQFCSNCNFCLSWVKPADRETPQSSSSLPPQWDEGKNWGEKRSNLQVEINTFNWTEKEGGKADEIKEINLGAKSSWIAILWSFSSIYSCNPADSLCNEALCLVGRLKINLSLAILIILSHRLWINKRRYPQNVSF